MGIGSDDRGHTANPDSRHHLLGLVRASVTGVPHIGLDEVNVMSKRGVVFRSETNVPLERITYVSVHQGPLMRNFGVHKASIERAGRTQSHRREIVKK